MLVWIVIFTHDTRVISPFTFINFVAVEILSSVITCSQRVYSLMRLSVPIKFSMKILMQLSGHHPFLRCCPVDCISIVLVLPILRFVHNYCRGEWLTVPLMIDRKKITGTVCIVYWLLCRPLNQRITNYSMGYAVIRIILYSQCNRVDRF